MFYRETEFKDTEIGKIPKDWEVVRLEDITYEFVSGGTPSTKNPKYWNGDIPWIRSVHITNYYIDERSVEQYITKEGLENSTAKIVPKNNVIIATRVGIGKSAVNLIDVAINQDLTGVILDRSKIDPFFLVWYLNSPKIVNLLESFSRGTTIKGIPQEYIKNLKIPLPPLEEQRKIAEILSTIDKAIQKTNEIIAKTERLKKGLMQELLTKGIGHTEFKKVELNGQIVDIPKDWEVVRLKRLADVKEGIYGKRDSKGAIIQLKADSITDDGKIDPTKYALITVNNKDISKYLLRPGDIILSNRNSLDKVGKCAIFQGEISECVYSNLLTRIRLISSEDIIPEWILYVLIKMYNDGVFKSLVTRAVNQVLLKKTVVENLEIPLPPLEEQKKIAQILSTVDKKLEIEKKEKEKLERIKRGFMDLLLTGKVRVCL